MSKKINISNKELYNLYVIKKLSSIKIAKILDCCKFSILKNLKKFKIKRRSTSEAKTTIIIHKDKLIELYCRNNLSAPKIAKIYKCASTTILTKLRKYNIKIRNYVESALRGNNSPVWVGGKERFKCTNCGKLLKNTKAKRCKKCFGESNRGKNSISWKGGTKKHKCVDCDNTISMDHTRCKKCSLEYHKGKKHPNWKGGITSVEKSIRNSLEYKQWRFLVYKRDHFTCIECRKGGGYLEAHHIKFFSELLQEAKEMFPLLPLYDAAMLYKPLWDTNNGITYCKKHHKEFHKEYSRVNREISTIK